MTWVYLSPHFDDVALSCGGLVWEQVHSGEQVYLWTICAGDPPEGPLTPFAHTLHDRWKTGFSAVAQRRAEDIASCDVLGASHKHFDTPDCIYRHSALTGDPIIRAEEDLTAWLKPGEAPLAACLARSLAEALPAGCNLVSPLALGGHVDHRLTRMVAESRLVRLRTASLCYYADYPYTLFDPFNPTNRKTREKRWISIVNPISPDGLEAWKRSISAYASQISTFWESLAEMEQAIDLYAKESGGVALWQGKSAQD